MQRDIARQSDILRNGDIPDLSPDSRQPPTQSHVSYISNHLHESHPPLSPRQMPQSDLTQRRPSHPSIFDSRSPQPAASFRGVAPHLSISPRRYGSIGSANNNYSSSSSRAPPPPPPPTAITPTQGASQHPLATVSSPPANLSRRHTAADIRSHGWDHVPPDSAGAPLPSPFGGLQPSTPQWPSSPARGTGDQAIRDALASYQLPRDSSSTSTSQVQSSHARTPPPTDPTTAITGTGSESGWQVPGSRFPGYGRSYAVGGASGGLDPSSSGGPPTRRSSMASNLHGLLNPTGESTVDEDGAEGSGAKRKRLG